MMLVLFGYFLCYIEFFLLFLSIDSRVGYDVLVLVFIFDCKLGFMFVVRKWKNL